MGVCKDTLLDGKGVVYSADHTVWSDGSGIVPQTGPHARVEGSVMRYLVLVLSVVFSSAAIAAEARRVEDDGLVVLSQCVREFDASPSHHRMLGVTEEALQGCLREARAAMEAEMVFIASMRPPVLPIESGLEGSLGRVVATTSSVALEGATVAMALS